MFILFLPKTPLRALRLCEIILVFFSRKGARNARNFDVYFVLSSNTSAYPASLRDFIVFSLAEAQRPRRTSMFILFLPQPPLRALRLCEIMLVFFSRQGARNAKNFDVYFVLIPSIFACFAPWRELFFFSRGGAEAAENFDVYFILT